MTTDAEVTEAIERLSNWVEQSHALMLEKRVPAGAKSAMASSSLQLAQEHTQAIRVLLQVPLQASALALLRPQLDSLTRGIWMSQCASEAWCQQFAEMGGDDAFSAKKMFTEINAAEPYCDGAFAQYSIAVKKQLHDFTHGGHQQIQARFKEQGAGIGYPRDNQMLFWCAEVAKHMDYMAKTEAARVLGDAGLISELLYLADPGNLIAAAVDAPREQGCVTGTSREAFP